MRLVCGVGINDGGYQVQRPAKDGEPYWICPYYQRWAGLLARCYSKTTQKNRPRYEGCSVDDRWYMFSKFRAWMEAQDWEGKQLDKDILQPSNRVYGPDTCVFVSQAVNSLLSKADAARGEYPLGVKRSKSGTFESKVGHLGGHIYLGTYPSPEEAHQAWQYGKIEAIDAAMDAEPDLDFRVVSALCSVQSKIRRDIFEGVETTTYQN